MGAKLSQELKAAVMRLSKGEECSPNEIEEMVRLNLVGNDPEGKIVLTQLGQAVVTRLTDGPKEIKPMAKAKRSGGKKGKGRKPAMTDKEFIAKRDGEMTKKYGHFEPGSLHRASGQSKLVCKIVCQKKGAKCTGTREVFSSDVFQIKKCLNCANEKVAKPAKKKAKKAAKAEASA